MRLNSYNEYAAAQRVYDQLREKAAAGISTQRDDEERAILYIRIHSYMSEPTQPNIINAAHGNVDIVNLKNEI